MSAAPTHAARTSVWGAIRISAGVVATTLGALLLASGVPAALAAATIEASVGKTGTVTQPLGNLRAAPSDVAVVVDGVTARLATPEPPDWVTDALARAGTDLPTLATEFGEVVLVATPAAGDAFLGVAPAEAVNDYLDGTPYTVAVSSAGEWEAISVPGDGVPTTLPQEQDLWVAAASGPAPTIPADALNGLTLVLMRSDGVPAPEAALRLEYRLPGAGTALQSAAVTAAAASIGGLMLVLLGGWMIVGRRRQPR
ncbi:MAG: hypothetical protein RLZ94_2624 [Actinomycetota bacterium]|jgi:hypothetical protein